MKYTSTFILLVTFSLFSNNASAQKYGVAGLVLDNDGVGISTVNVSLLKEVDTTWLQTETTEVDGSYVFNDVIAGKYYIAVNALGYNDTLVPITVLGNILDFKCVLQKGNNYLNQVVVKGRRDMLRTELGKTVLDIGNSAKEGKNLLEVLQQLPGVRVSPSGVISVQGKQGLVVLVNDKPTYLQGEELATYLRGVSAADVKNVALMTQPSAKYDADGNVGIISINMNKNKKDGISGNAMVRHAQSVYGVSAANGTVNYKRGRATLYVSPGTYFGSNSLARERLISSYDSSTSAINTTIKEDAFLRETYKDYNLKLGTDIELTDKIAFGGYIKGVYHTNDELDNTKTVIVDNTVSDKKINVALNNNGHTRKLWFANAYLDHKFSDKHKATTQLDFFRTDRNIYQRILNTNYDRYGSALPDSRLVYNDVPIISDLYSAKIDYTGSIEKFELESGLKSSYVWINDQNLFYVSSNGRMKYDSGRSNNFRYRESINAAYISASTKSGKWQAKSGLRVEASFIDGKELVQQESFSRKKLSLFPTAYVSYKVDSNNTLECNYGRRIKRPFYRELNPFTRFESQYSYSVGNPNLQPQYANNLELKHNYNNRLITSLHYNNTTNLFTRVFEYDEQTKVSNYSTTNRGNSQSVDLSMYLSLPVIQEWLLTCTGRGWYIANNAGENKKEGWGYTVSLDSQFTFKNGWYADFNVRYTSTIMQATTTSVAPSVWSSANVSKKLFNDSGTLKLALNDPFNLYRYKPTFTNGTTSSMETNTFSASAAILSFSYNFGTKNGRKKRTGTTDELNRM